MTVTCGDVAAFDQEDRMTTLYYATGACSLAPHIVLEWIGAPYEAVKVLRWPGFVGQFGGFAKLGSGSRQAANLVSSCALVPIVPYASSGVRPFSPECGRRPL